MQGSGGSRVKFTCWSHFITIFLLFILVLYSLKIPHIFKDMASKSLGCVLNSSRGSYFYMPITPSHPFSYFS